MQENEKNRQGMKMTQDTQRTNKTTKHAGQTLENFGTWKKGAAACIHKGLGTL